MNSLFNRPDNRFTVLFLSVLFLLLPFYGQAQDISFARQVIDTLISPYMGGRGYVEDGDKRSAAYIAGKMQEFGLQPLHEGIDFPENYYQRFNLNVNTFPAEMSFSVNGNELRAGYDFQIHPNSGGGEYSLKVVRVPKNARNSIKNFRRFLSRQNFSNVAVVVYQSEHTTDEGKEIYAAVAANVMRAPVVVTVQQGDLIWSVGRRQSDYIHIQVKEDVFPQDPATINVNVTATYIDYNTQNVIGWFPGRSVPDSFIFIIGHYDHLGRMGSEVYIPGANDNASGIAIILDLARHYSLPENRQEYSLVFIAFGAEEAGLVGSRYYVENPVFPLESTVFVSNLDLMGTGEDGITTVNATVFPQHFEGLIAINNRYDYLPAINSRGKAANSDHHFFTEAGVPSFFHYMLGPYKHYHNVHDKGPLSLAGYEGMFRLIVNYNNWLQGGFSK